MTLFLLIMWLLLNNTLAFGHIVLGGLIALLIPLLIQPLNNPRPGVHKPLFIFKYIVVLLGDIIISNIQVAILICGKMSTLQPGIFAVPLDIEGELPITMLANTISLTPGTVSAELSADRKWLYVHALHLQDEHEEIRRIKNRYEQPLREIFGC